MARVVRFLALLALCGLLGRVARADGLDGQRFVPASGAAGGLMVERPLVPRHLGVGAALFLNYARKPVVLYDPSTEQCSLIAA